MKIDRISVYQVDLPLHGPYGLSGGRSLDALDSTIVSIEADTGLIGWGESCPFGPSYLPDAIGPGIRASIADLAPLRLGSNPLHLGVLNARMDKARPGHLSAKSALDIACWDILGKATNLSVSELLGGPEQGHVDLISSVSSGTPYEMLARVERFREKGYRNHSFKLGGEERADVECVRAVMDQAQPGEFYFADANAGLSVADALRVARVLRDFDLIFEQPCATHAECAAVQRRTECCIMLDEIIDDLSSLLLVVRDQSADAINIKITRHGGLTKARLIRDVCVGAGLIMSIQDTGGSQIAKAATAHLALSTPEKLRYYMWDCTELISVSTADGIDESVNGSQRVPTAPGLGIQPKMEVLGEPVAIYELNV